MKTRRKPINHSNSSICCSQKQRSRVRRHQARIERRFHRPAFNSSKNKIVLGYTASGFLSNLLKVAGAQRLSLIRNPDAQISLRNPG
jgi:hypothetical protein